jgi:ribose 1,5-bisphosphokinase
MTDTAAPDTRTAKTGPGRLVLVVGPSGAGKDTLIDLARAACSADKDIIFARRVVTREASASEDNEQMSEAAFRQALADGAFAIHWDAHGLRYALRSEIDGDIRAGRAVVANVSRTVIPAMRAAYADVVVVSITAPPEILAARLAARERQSDGDVAVRLQRQVSDAAVVPDVVISNVGSAKVHADGLVRAIRSA